jgi:DNA uptake protein ComE-like DNA-binding protein
MKVKLKEGLTTIASTHYELKPGVVVDIADRLFNEEVMDKVSDSGKKKGSAKKEEKAEKKAEPKKKESPKKESPKKEDVKKSFEDELIDLPGIGPKIAEQILNMAKTKEGLSKIPRQTLIDELRDDAVIVLDKYLGR